MNELYLYAFEDGTIGVSGLPPLRDDVECMRDGTLAVFKLDILNGGPSVCEIDKDGDEVPVVDVFPDETNSYHAP